MVPDFASMTAEELEAHEAALKRERDRRRDLGEVRALAWRYVNNGGRPERVIAEAADGAGVPPETVSGLLSKTTLNREMN